MSAIQSSEFQTIARSTGGILLGSLILGILTAILFAKGIDINLSGDVIATADNMLNAESRLHAKAYMGTFLFVFDVIVTVGFFLLLKNYNVWAAQSALYVSLGGAILMLLGTVFAMNAAQIAGNSAYQTLASAEQRHLLAGLQATSDYTSFHLGLILTTMAKAGFFYLFLRSGLISKIIAGWGVFASLFVVLTIIVRDFVPALGHDMITMAFMLCNLIAIVATGLYLVIKGVRMS